MNESMRDWGPPVSLFVLVIGGASVGLLFGPDAAYWWVPLFVAFVVLPALIAVVLAVMVTLELMWGSDDVLQMLTRMLGSSVDSTERRPFRNFDREWRCSHCNKKEVSYTWDQPRDYLGDWEEFRRREVKDK